MLQFLETFERRSWRCQPEFPFIVPISKADVREPAFGGNSPTAR